MLEEEEEELPLHDQAFISILPCADGSEDVSVEEMQAARVLARHDPCLTPNNREQGLGELPATQELTSGFRAMLADSHFSRGRSSGGSAFDPFEDPTYTAELARKEVLALLACDPQHESARRNSLQLKPLVRVGQRSARGADAPAWSDGDGFQIFDESDLG